MTGFGPGSPSYHSTSSINGRRSACRTPGVRAGPVGQMTAGMPCEHVLSKPEGAILTMALSRPETRNALSLEVMLELTAAVEEAGASDALGVILAANGPVFCAGHN